MSNTKNEWTVKVKGKKPYKTHGIVEAVRFVMPEIDPLQLSRTKALINYHVKRKGKHEWNEAVFTYRVIKATEPRPDIGKALNIIDTVKVGEIASRTGLKENTISNYKMRRRSPSTRVIAKIIKEFS